MSYEQGDGGDLRIAPTGMPVFKAPYRHGCGCVVADDFEHGANLEMGHYCVIGEGWSRHKWAMTRVLSSWGDAVRGRPDAPIVAGASDVSAMWRGVVRFTYSLMSPARGTENLPALMCQSLLCPTGGGLNVTRAGDAFRNGGNKAS